MGPQKSWTHQQAMGPAVVLHTHQITFLLFRVLYIFLALVES